MAIITRKPVTHGSRGLQVIKFRDVITSTTPVKALTKGRNRIDARNNRGVKTMTGRGGGAKRRARFVDLKQDQFGIPGRVESIQYDPNRTAFIAHINFANGHQAYILAPEGLKPGDKVVSGENTKIKLGNRLQLKNIPAGITVHNIELVPNRGGQIARTAGGSAMVMAFDAGYALIKLPSGEVRKIVDTCYASIGSLSNPDHMNIRLAKAGRNRLMGRRPTTRGKVKNPVDHPHGGGEGSTSVGMKHPKTKTGKPALGYKTRNRKKTTNRFIVKPRAKKRK
jgi:large subunit ribosomal protein L2